MGADTASDGTGPALCLMSRERTLGSETKFALLSHLMGDTVGAVEIATTGPSRAEDPTGLAASDDPRLRVIVAAAACVGRWGMTRTRVDDVAREAGLSRATVYRHFPGGKDEILTAVSSYEEGRFFAALLPELVASDSLEDCLVIAISEASRFLRESEVLGYLAAHEPEILYPHLAFDRCGPLLYRVTGRVGPQLERFVRPEHVAEVAEWATRLVLSYWLQPGSLDLADPATARRLVAGYLLPGLEAETDRLRPTSANT